MRRLFRLVLILMLVVGATVIVARLVGGTHPASPLVSMFTTPEGAACEHPCLFGIQPGVTNTKQAVLLLRAHPLTRDGKWLDTNWGLGPVLSVGRPEAYIAFSQTSNGLVDSIVMTDDRNDSGIAVPGSLPDSARIGDLIAMLGAPNNVELPGSDYTVVSYPEAGIIVAVARPDDPGTYVQADNPLSMVLLSVAGPCPKVAAVGSAHPWLGFTRLGRYTGGKSFRLSMRYSGVPLPPYATCQD